MLLGIVRQTQQYNELLTHQPVLSFMCDVRHPLCVCVFLPLLSLSVVLGAID